MRTARGQDSPSSTTRSAMTFPGTRRPSRSCFTARMARLRSGTTAAGAGGGEASLIETTGPPFTSWGKTVSGGTSGCSTAKFIEMGIYQQPSAATAREPGGGEARTIAMVIYQRLSAPTARLSGSSTVSITEKETGRQRSPRTAPELGVTGASATEREESPLTSPPMGQKAGGYTASSIETSCQPASSSATRLANRSQPWPPSPGSTTVRSCW